MNTEFWVTCPYCFESMEIYIEPDVSGEFVQDCEVCCQPWRIRLTRDADGDGSVDVSRAQ